MKRTISTLLLVLLCLTPITTRYWIQETYGAECEDSCSDPVQLARMSPAILGASSGAVAYTCATGTYMFWWDGDYSGDTSMACSASGAATKTGSSSGDVSIDANYVRITDVNSYLRWEIVAEDIFNDSQGTIFFSVYFVDEGNGDLDDDAIFEIYKDTNNYLGCWATDSDNKVKCQVRGNGNTAQNVSTASTLSTGNWYRIGYSWQTGADAGGKHSIVIQSGETAVSSWDAEVENTEDLDDWGSAPQYVTLGENQLGITLVDDVRIKDVIITSGYKDADQL